MNRSQTRISCPRCQANNFPGQTNCFQCGSSLPPPDAFVHAPIQPPAAPVQQQPYYPPQYAAQQPQAPPFYPQAFGPVRARRAPWIAPVAAVVVVLFLLMGVLYVFRQHVGSQSTRGVSSDMATIADHLDQIRKQNGLDTKHDDSLPTETANAQKALQQAREKYGLGGSGSGESEGISSSAGAVTFGDWQRSHPDKTNYEFR